MATAKETTNYKDMNIFQKLQEARCLFLKENVKKSGKNMNLEFMYFELADIVPAAEEIFRKVGLMGLPTFPTDKATMYVYDTDHPETEPLAFTLPFDKLSPIISNSGKAVTNEMQALGSSITYIRRYLWMLVLDVVEADTIDATLGEEPKVKGAAETPAKPKATAHKAPATPQKREEIKKELTSPKQEVAPAAKVKALKESLKKLLKADPKQEEFVQEIALKTKAFKDISESQCDDVIANVEEILKNYKEG